MKHLAPLLLLLYCIILAVAPTNTNIIQLFAPTENGSMSVYNYGNRSQYVFNLYNTKTNLVWSVTNSTPGGPFKFTLTVAKPDASLPNVAALSMYSVQTMSQPPSERRRRLPSSTNRSSTNTGTGTGTGTGTTTTTTGTDPGLDGNVNQTAFDVNTTMTDASTASNFVWNKEVTLANLEAMSIGDKTNSDANPSNTLTFRTKFTFYFFATETGAYGVLYLKVECPVVMTRPAGVTGVLSNLQTTMLSTTVDAVNINLSITASLVACNDTYSVYSTCTEIYPAPSQKLNTNVKYKLYLTDTTMASTFYLRPYKVTLQSETMSVAVDFTPLISCPIIALGKMIFSLPMAIVGNAVTLSATATLALTSSRRMLTTGTDATIAFSTAAVTTSDPTTSASPSTNDASNIDTVSNSPSVLMVLSMILLCITIAV